MRARARRWRSLLAAVALAGLAAVVEAAQHPSPPAAPADARQRAEAAHARKAGGSAIGELDCLGCHQSKHRGVVQMYIGQGGRGTGMIPGHMFQVRVQCVACHSVPEFGAGTAQLIGQTFRPSEQACLGCHGQKYKGMLGQWIGTLGTMRDTIEPKLDAARVALTAADPRSPRVARARKLVEDAGYNQRFVELARGVHNVFYAADLLRLANAWLDDALALLGKEAASPAEEFLVRGGYCGVLCHQAAGVKQPPFVTFGTRRIPHVRHVAEFGATCASCHSAETHKAVTATPATCMGCHHGASNTRCENCHRQQAAFYRGRAQSWLAAIGPNPMAESVPCTGCHDTTQKHSRAAVTRKCLECHERPYTLIMSEWGAGYDAEIRRATEALRGAETAIAAARRAGRRTPEAEALAREARDALALIRTAKVAHNPLAADALIAAALGRAEEARTRASGGRASGTRPAGG